MDTWLHPSCRYHVSSSKHSDLSFAYRFKSLIYGLGTLSTGFFLDQWSRNCLKRGSSCKILFCASWLLWKLKIQMSTLKIEIRSINCHRHRKRISDFQLDNWRTPRKKNLFWTPAKLMNRMLRQACASNKLKLLSFNTQCVLRLELLPLWIAQHLFPVENLLFTFAKTPLGITLFNNKSDVCRSSDSHKLNYVSTFYLLKWSLHKQMLFYCCPARTRASGLGVLECDVTLNLW